MTTFHPFPRLPGELRAQIWEMTVEPRTIEVHILRKNVSSDAPFRTWQSVPYLFSSTPVPATLQTCQEARNQGLYWKAFFDLAVRNGAPSDSERRYVWLNLGIDMVSIGKTDLHCFKSVARMIRRLKFERANDGEYWTHTESERLRQFVNSTEIHVVAESGDLRDWHGASEDYYWPCGNENVFMINPVDGQITNIIELEDKYDLMLEEEYRQQNPDDQVSFRNSYPIDPFD